jgi:hypothetical protein
VQQVSDSDSGIIFCDQLVMTYPIDYIYHSPGNIDVWFCNAAGATDPDPLLIKWSGRQELHVGSL